MTCSLSDCNGTVKALGLCNKHYLRLKRHGSPTAGAPGRYQDDDLRLWSQVQPTGFCWLWTGSTTDGYGYVRRAGAQQRVHRVGFEILVGSIPDGAELDHLCRVRSCCNPDHLEPVARVVNNARGQSPTARNRRKTHCPEGHEYDIEIARRGGIERRCSHCEKTKRRARTEREAAERLGVTRQHLQQALIRHPHTETELAA